MAILPRSRTHVPRKPRIERDGNSPRQADLTTMRVTADHHVKACVSSIPVNFRRVRNQN